MVCLGSRLISPQNIETEYELKVIRIWKLVHCSCAVQMRLSPSVLEQRCGGHLKPFYVARHHYRRVLRSHKSLVALLLPLVIIS